MSNTFHISCIAILLLVIYLEYNKISTLEADNSVLRSEYTLLDNTLKDEQAKFKASIKKLEDELTQYTIDAELYTCTIATKTKDIDDKTEEEESKIKKELNSDSSIDNQLNISRRLLDEFSSTNK